MLDLTPVYAVIRFAGSEALEFLQRQLSNDIMLLGPEIAQVNAYLTPKTQIRLMLENQSFNADGLPSILGVRMGITVSW